MKWFACFVFLVAITLSGVGVVGAESYQDYLQKAYKAQSLYQVQKAEHWFRQALELEDGDPAIHLALARTLFAQLKNQEALDLVQTVLERHPQHAQAHYFLCRFYWKVQHDIEKAEHHGQLAAQYDQQHAGAKTLLGEIYLSRQKYSEAESVFRDLIEIDPTSSAAHAGLGNALIKQNRIAEAVEALKQAVQIDPNYSESYRFLAVAYAQSGKSQRAQEAQRQYQESKSKRQRIENLLGQLHKEPDNAGAWFDLGKEYLRQDYPTAKAVEAFEKGLYFDANQPDIHNLLGTLYLQAKQIQSAKNHLLTAISLAPKDVQAYNNLGVAYLLEKNYEKAVAYLEKSVALGNDDPGVQQNLEFAKKKLQEHQ